MNDETRKLTTKDIFNPAPSGEEPFTIEEVTEVVRMTALIYKQLLIGVQCCAGGARDLLIEAQRIAYPTNEGGPNVNYSPEHAKHLITAASSSLSGATSGRWSHHEVETDLREGFNEIMRLAKVQEDRIEKLNAELASAYAANAELASAYAANAAMATQEETCDA